MLGGRAGLCWVGGRVYVGWEGESMLGESCPFLFFAQTNFSSLTHFSRILLGWSGCVPTCVCACVAAAFFQARSSLSPLRRAARDSY